MGKTSLVSMLSSGGKAFPKNYKMVRSAALLPCRSIMLIICILISRLLPHTGVDSVETCSALPDSMLEVKTNRTGAACRPPAPSSCQLLSPQRMAALQWNSCCWMQPALRSLRISH